MRSREAVPVPALLRALRIGVLLILAAALVEAQTSFPERVFPQSKTAVEKALKAMQVNLSGRLPALDGFAKSAEHSLDRYQRGFYQATVQVSSTASGGSLVRVSAKVTAWYSDPVASHSGYQVLASNGRIEQDLLDQLAEQLAGSANANDMAAPVAPAKPSAKPGSTEPAVPVPSAPSSSTANEFSSSLSQSLEAQERASAQMTSPPNLAPTNSSLQAEADSLEEIVKNVSHPKNLVAVKKLGTPVVASPSLTAKPLFLASLHDEFEMLDFNRDWVHVRISGLSRGWIWRNSLEMPEGIPDTEVPAGPAPVAAADLFHVVREETSPFPGDWEPLRGKNVRIFSVQKIDENAKGAGPRERLEYAKFLLDTSYTEMTQKPQDLAGIVLIFDSADGGMIAATVATLQQWKAGTLSDSALWHRCFFDPPETFDSNGAAGSPSR
ncbi:MAG TPA: hypothetical protein VJ999_08815 [Candidatus Sulfotelmatobacter sp.]|nr:hypothetical protein [Candidatus Sulfotelmatobacter sp.]